MHFLSFIAVAGILSTSAVSAEPTQPQLPKAVDCKAVNLALTVLKNFGPPATSFCSSYLKVPGTKTVSTTTTTSTTTLTTSTLTVTVTSDVCEAPMRRSPGQLSNDRSSDPQARDVDIELDKRLNIPALSVFAAAKISSGCSCLSLMPKTSVTATITAPPSTVNVVATTTACVMPVCTTAGGRCDFSRPDLCCGYGCSRGVLFPTCFDAFPPRNPY